uniref:C6 domain-containing protein n=1 Tax=Panagrolaimus sp. PS1159 TaxID=55785 RepID=A0AC35GV23_9BILA
MSYLIFCMLSLSFLLANAQKCGSCGNLEVGCGAEDAGLLNGIVQVTYGNDAEGCRTMYVNCSDDLISGDPTALAITTVNNGDLSLTAETLVTCNRDGSWFGNGVNTVVCQISRNIGGNSTIEDATCKKSNSIRYRRAIPEASGCFSQWSNWAASVPCQDYCGACFNATYTRTCLTSLTCPCTGPSTLSKACNQNVCGYPRRSCCGSLKALSSHSELICSLPELANLPESYPDTIAICPPQGIWGTWTESCNSTCGAYGIGTRRRTCLTAAAGCSCTGDAVQTNAPCNLLPCIDRISCNTGFKLTVESGLIICAKTDVVTIPITACPPFGVWETWGTWSTCGSTCGGCAQTTRARICASTKYGCPCDNSPSSETQPCNRIACATGTQCCSPLIPYTLASGETLCYPPSTVFPTETTAATTTATGTTTAIATTTIAGTTAATTTVATTTVSTTVATSGWTEWAASSCTASCGLCGRITMRRVCLSGNCAGISVLNSTQSCGASTLCPAGLNLPSCCAPAVRAVVNNLIACAIPSN